MWALLITMVEKCEGLIKLEGFMQSCSHTFYSTPIGTSRAFPAVLERLEKLRMHQHMNTHILTHQNVHK